MYELRDYQKTAVEKTIRHFQQSKNPSIIVLPTGAGKSLVIAELARIARGRVLVLAHVKELVEQNHSKYESYGLSAGIYSAGLNRKEFSQKVIFGSIQSIARAKDDFFSDFSLLVIDECHRVSMEGSTQYGQVIEKLKLANPGLCILGLSATPYRMGTGWIYEFHHKGAIKSKRERFFKKCIYEVSLSYMINQGYLTAPIKIDSPVACYDFSKLMLKKTKGSFSMTEVEEVLKDQERVTPGIIGNIIELAEDRKGVMLFTSTVRHAQEILSYLPKEESALVIGDTDDSERDKIIQNFKDRKFKYLVNVSVLTTGFDAPHVDLIAILRPTESVSLYQQIVGRGLRLSENKQDCLILDYTGMGHNLFSPEIDEDRPVSNAVAVKVTCPQCGFINDFWGIMDSEAVVVEHFGRKCQGGFEDPSTEEVSACDFLFRYKLCDQCGQENDISARHCSQCKHLLVDNDTKLRKAMELKDAHVMRPELMTMEKSYDKKGTARLEVKYYDCDAESLTEYFYLENISDAKAFYYNFIRMHNKRPENFIKFSNVDDVISQRKEFRLPLFVIARKQKHYWKIREKIFY